MRWGLYVSGGSKIASFWLGFVVGIAIVIVLVLTAKR